MKTIDLVNMALGKGHTMSKLVKLYPNGQFGVEVRKTQELVEGWLEINKGQKCALIVDGTVHYHGQVSANTVTQFLNECDYLFL